MDDTTTCVTSAVDAAHAAAVGAVRDAASVFASNAADKRFEAICICRSGSADGASRHGAVADGAVVVNARYAADVNIHRIVAVVFIVSRCETAAAQGHVPDGSLVITEQAQRFNFPRQPVAGAVDAADGVALAVEGALEAVGVDIESDGRIVVGAGVGDVGSLLEAHATGIVARVDVGGEGVEGCGAIHHVVRAVGIGLDSELVAAEVLGGLRPRRHRREHHQEQRYRCPRNYRCISCIHSSFMIIFTSLMESLGIIESINMGSSR